MNTPEKVAGVAVLGGLAYLVYEAYEHRAKTAQTPRPVTHTVTQHVTHTVRRTARITSTSHTTQSTTRRSTAKSANRSPLGTNPAATPRNCPSGYKPRFQSGYGWFCQETTAREIANLKAAYSLAGSTTGTSVVASGVSVGGLSPYQQALLARQTLAAKYGGTWGVYWQNGTYLVVPPSRVTYLMSIGGDNIKTVTSSGQPGVAMHLTTSRSASGSYTASAHPVTTPRVEPTYISLQNAAVRSAAAAGSVPANYTGYHWFKQADGHYVSLYVQNGYVTSINSSGQRVTIRA